VTAEDIYVIYAYKYFFCLLYASIAKYMFKFNNSNLYCFTIQMKDKIALSKEEHLSCQES